MKILGKIRLVPVTIFAATLMLTMKVADIFDDFNLQNIPLQLSKAVAQDQTPKPNTTAQDEKKSQQKATSGANNKTTSTEKESSKSKESEKGEASGKDEDNPDNDPTLFTQSEIDLLQELSDRREQIEKMSKQINLREGLLKAAEKRISKRVSELKQLQKTINDLIKTHDDQQETKIASLVKIYEAMKPKDAARIFEQLDLNTLLIVAERMKERKLAPVMAQMNPEKAKDVTVELSRLRDLPLPGTLVIN